jgi:hypothetical protein
MMNQYFTLKEKAADGLTRFIKSSELVGYTRLLIWILGLRQHARHFIVFQQRIFTLWQNSGPKFVVSYLQEGVRLVQHSVAGTPSKSTGNGVYVAVNRMGVPKIIPGPLRRLIASRDTSVIRGVLTLLSVYRVIHCPPKLKIETITGPFSGIDPTLPEMEVLQVWKDNFSSLVGSLGKVSPSLIRKAGPNSSSSWVSLFADGMALRANPTVYGAFLKLCTLTPGGDEFHQWLLKTVRIHEIKILQELNIFTTSVGPSKKVIPNRLGKLSTKEEAAGKVRVFAITDW